MKVCAFNPNGKTPYIQKRYREPEEPFVVRNGRGVHQLLIWAVHLAIDPLSEFTLLGLVTCVTLLIGALRKLSRRGASTRKICATLRSVIASRYVALETIEIDTNFHRLQMVSKTSGQRVFMKCLRATATRIACIGFAREHRTLRALNHPNIVNMVDWTRVGASCCISLEYSSYGNLKTVMTTTANNLKFMDRLFVLGSLGYSSYSGLKSAMTINANTLRFTDKLSVFRALGYSSISELKSAINTTARNLWLKDRLSVFKQVVSAIQYLHREGWAHLNIRPECVFVFQPWTLVKLSGFSRVLKVKEYEKEVSCRYDIHWACSPPEIRKREPYIASKADIWALGSLLLFLHTGDCIHADTDLPKVSELLNSLNNEFTLPPMGQYQRLLTAMLSSNPTQRPDSSTVLQILTNSE